MANTMQTPAKPQDFGTDIKLGSGDDTKMVELVLQRASAFSAKVSPDTYFWVDLTWDGPLYCEDSINWPGTETQPAKNLAAIFNTESRTLGLDKATGIPIPADQADVLGNAKNMVVRNRAHWVVDWAKHCKITRYKIKGPHTDAYRNRSIASVLEQQCGIWMRSTVDMEVCAGTILDVWGDDISMHSVKPYGKPNENPHIWANTFDRNGREVVLLSAMANGNVHDNTVKRHTSQIFHSETGSGQSNPPSQGIWQLHNNVVLDVPGEQVGYFLHCTGGARVDEIWVQDNLVKGQAFQIFVDPYGTLPDPTEDKVRELWVLDNTWDKAPAGGYVLNARDITEVHYRRQKGPARKNFSISSQLHTERCDIVDINTTGITQ
jgi:hypothetical protein